MVQNPKFLFSEDKKPPKGFEKFGKKDKKEEVKKESSKEPESEEEKTDKEEEPKQKESSGNDWKNMFVDPNGGGPTPFAWILGALAACGLYLSLGNEKHKKELVYMDFVNNYLLKNNVKEIRITKDKRSDSFSYRAEITTNDDQEFYITLASHDTFLAKLDLTQREMGRDPSNFIPVKYVNH